MINFEVTYLPDIFSNITTIKIFKVDNAYVNAIRQETNISKAMTDIYESVIDNINAERVIQVSYENRYKVEFIDNENRDIKILELAGKVSFTDEDGLTYDIYNISVNPSFGEKHRPVKYTVEFSRKEINNFATLLSSDAAKEWNSAGNTVNILSVIINKPSYTQKTTLIRNSGTTQYEFDFTLNDFTDNIQVNDNLYWHFNNAYAPLYGGITVTCTAKSATDISFESVDPAADSGNLVTEVTLDFKPEFAVSVGLSDRDLSFSLYTFLYPKENISVIVGEDSSKRDGLELVTDRTLRKTVTLPFWIKTDNENELLKFRYLNTINEAQLLDDLTLTLADSNTEYTIETKEFIERNDRKDLNNLIEFNLILKQENAKIDLFR